MHFFLLISFPNGKVPAETFVDPNTFQDLDHAVQAAGRFIREENATEVVIYLCDNSQNDTHNVRMLKISK
jgi:hypothetical protein